jgi:hypothetical protein
VWLAGGHSCKRPTLRSMSWIGRRVPGIDKRTTAGPIPARSLLPSRAVRVRVTLRAGTRRGEYHDTTYSLVSAGHNRIDCSEDTRSHSKGTASRIPDDP